MSRLGGYLIGAVPRRVETPYILKYQDLVDFTTLRFFPMCLLLFMAPAGGSEPAGHSLTQPNLS